MANASEAKEGLERVTDYVAEQELDASTSTQALSAIATTEQDRQARQAQITVQQEDVEVLKQELGVDAREAEAMLRENEGSLHATVLAYLRS
mmetsp:Transcript_7199/g.24272  ORF Transcript_7199/g.24272 Transcript_7199/m.24272 type:complete len:92 (-) Transcript_7199:60-335(-)